jgi:hypothetical protein
MITVRTATARLLSTSRTPILPKIVTSAPKKAERIERAARMIEPMLILRAGLLYAVGAERFIRWIRYSRRLVSQTV